jgi:hypothetical protein
VFNLSLLCSLHRITRRVQGDDLNVGACFQTGAHLFQDQGVAMDDYFARISLHMNYGEIGGKTEPPITSLTVFTVVPLAARGCSQLSRAEKSAVVMEYKWRVVFFIDFLFEIASS